MNRFQISIFGAVAIVFAVFGANSVFSPLTSVEAMGAGWLITAIVDILWVLYFTSEEDSLLLYIFNSFGTGGLTPPSRRRRRATSAHNMGSPGNGYAAPYGSGGVGPAMYDTKIPGNGSFHGDGVEPTNRSTGGSVKSPMSNTATSLRGESTVGSPMMSAGNAGIGAGGGQTSPSDDKPTMQDEFSYKAKALYSCKLLNLYEKLTISS
jgi:SHO1 osmosensor